MEISSQSSAYINQQSAALKQEASAQAQNTFPEPPPPEASAPRQPYPDESRQKANLESSLWQAAQRSGQSQGMEQGKDNLDKYTDMPSKRAVQGIAAYEAIQQPEQKVSLDALI
ncbi:MAG TPA: hypothetical protein DE179_11155 [Oceanospirillaceae bacterium]|nr:hypothetical protein [Oceanospirillaceae bacterium]